MDVIVPILYVVRADDDISVNSAIISSGSAVCTGVSTPFFSLSGLVGFILFDPLAVA